MVLTVLQLIEEVIEADFTDGDKGRLLVMVATKREQEAYRYFKLMSRYEVDLALAVEMALNEDWR